MRKMGKVWAFVASIIMCVSLSSCAIEGDGGTTAESSIKSESVEKGIYLGETAKNSSGIEFTVTSIEDTKKIGYATTENNFAVVTVKISNKGKEPWEQNPNNCVLILDGAEYEYNSATYYLNNGMSSFTEINPNITKTMSIVFETPTKLSEDVYTIKLSGYSIFRDNSVSIILKERA